MKILVIDDDKLVAVSLKTIIEADADCEVVAIGNSGSDAIRLFDEYEPDVLLMDIRMEGMTGLAAGEKILEKHKNAKILYLTTFNDDEYIVKALTMGAKGYIIKQDFEGIVPSIKTVYEGQTVFGSEVIKKLPNMIGGRKGVTSKHDRLMSMGLTEQEADIAECVADGLSNKEIADELSLSEGTVRNYLSSILGKLELRDRTNLAIFYYNKV